MADIHILEKFGRGTSGAFNVRVVFHVDAPVDAKVRVGLAQGASANVAATGSASLVPGLETDDAAEYAQLLSGAVIEHVTQIVTHPTETKADFAARLRGEWSSIQNAAQAKALERYSNYKDTLNRA